jgi:Protein of unknown function (DUF4238)
MTTPATPTRRQHYVWQKYLEPWTVKKGKARQLWCLRRKGASAFLVDTKNVAVERDFYRLSALTKADAAFIRRLAFNDKTNQSLRALNVRWIEIFETLFGLLDLGRTVAKGDRTALEALEREMIESQEREHSRLESAASQHMAALVAGKVAFFEDDTNAVEFSYFLAQQYFRTKAIRDRIRETFQESEKALFDRTWPILRHIFATNIGYSIFANRRSMPLQVMRAAPDMEFITSDQPVVNTHGAFMSPTTPVEELELYYPISPTRAVIISGHSVYRDIHGKELHPFRTSYLNQAIELVAYEQLLAKSEAALNAIAPGFCRRSQ